MALARTNKQEVSVFIAMVDPCHRRSQTHQTKTTPVARRKAGLGREPLLQYRPLGLRRGNTSTRQRFPRQKKPRFLQKRRPARGWASSDRPLAKCISFSGSR